MDKSFITNALIIVLLIIVGIILLKFLTQLVIIVIIIGQLTYFIDYILKIKGNSKKSIL